VSENVWPETDPKFFGRTKFNGPSLSLVVCTCVDVGGGVCEGERGRESVREGARKCVYVCVCVCVSEREKHVCERVRESVRAQRSVRPTYVTHIFT